MLLLSGSTTCTCCTLYIGSALILWTTLYQLHYMHEAEKKTIYSYITVGTIVVTAHHITSLGRSEFDPIREIRAGPRISSPQSCDPPTPSRLGGVPPRISPGPSSLFSGALLYEYITFDSSPTIFVCTHCVSTCPFFFTYPISRFYDSLHSRLS